MRSSRLLLGAILLVASAPAFASNVAVGTCKPSLPSFLTIQQAVNSVPPGTTVQVCPGTYAEQVVIGKNLILKGITATNQGAAVITVPNGGLVQSTVSLATGRPIAAQLLVQAPALAVTVTNLTVDGTNNGISDCTLNPIGIYYQNASGTITRTSVLNEVLRAGIQGCESGLGIFVQSGNAGASIVSITNNHVENYQKNGITGNEAGTSVTITGNTVIGQGSTIGAAENSIQIGFGATGSIKNNTVGSDVWAPDVFGDTENAAAGLLVYASAGVMLAGNNVNNTQFGIGIVSDTNFGNADGAQITKNTISATHLYDGIDLCSNNNTVTGNIINGSDESAVHVDDVCTGSSTGNQITKNTINSACAGILSGPGAAGNTTAPNTYYNVGTLRLDGTNVCTPPLAPSRKHAAKPHPRFEAARPKREVGHS